MSVADCVEMITTIGGFRPVDAWLGVAEWLREVGAWEPRYDLANASVDSDKIADVLRGKHHFGIHGQKFEIQFAQIGNYDHCRLCVLPLVASEDLRWDSFVERAIPPDTLICGRKYDREYQTWQDAKDPLQYEAAGRSYAQLRTYFDPQPLFGGIRIDTSSNPGRRILRNGFIEAVGSTMWLGPRFAERVGCELRTSA